MSGLYMHLATSPVGLIPKGYHRRSLKKKKEKKGGAPILDDPAAQAGDQSIVSQT